MDSMSLISINAYAKWSDVWPEGEPLFKQQWEEVRRNGEFLPFSVNARGMQRLFDLNMMTIATARVEKELVGYLFWFTVPCMESLGNLIAAMGPYFVLLEFGGAGKMLWNASLERLKSIGVKAAYPHVSVWGERRDRVERFYTSVGAEPFEIKYELRL